MATRTETNAVYTAGLLPGGERRSAMSMDTCEAASPAAKADRVLLDAKLSVPEPRAGSVGRAGLVETARSSHCRVVGITAPAGYGKSAFLAQWAAAEDRRVAWVSLDRLDDDPAVLLASVASACCRAGLCDADLAAGLGDRSVPALACGAPRLAAALSASPVPFVLMLDGLHELRSPACRDVLEVVISAIPRGSQLAAASRSEQPHLPRYRVYGDALEFGPVDLALDAGGARQIFAHANVSLTPERAAAMAEQTEGWPVGLSLAALIAEDSRGQPATVTGDDRYVADYLYHEVLSEQPKAVQRFLRRTAVLDQLSASLCEAVLGSPAAAVDLRRLEADGLFLIPLDRRRQRYRYHAMFREFLLGELCRTEPGIVMTLRQRAADWFESNGCPELALEQLLHTDDWDRSVRLAASLARPARNAGQLPTVGRWFAAIGDANIRRYPPLAVLAGWAGVLTGDAVRAEGWATFADTASFESAPADGSASFDSARAMLRAGMCAAGPEQMMADAAFAVAQEPAWSPYRDTALWLLGEAHRLAGRTSEARSLLDEASATAATMNSSGNLVLCESELAVLAMDRGEWGEAADRLGRALATVDESGMHDHAMSVLAFAAAARLSLHHCDVKQAGRQLDRAMRARPSATYVLPFVAVRLRLQLAKVCVAMADPVTARQLLREIDDILVRRPALGTLVDEVDEFRSVLAPRGAPGAPARPPLTAAELRVLPYLQTHLTVRGIAEQLFVSPETVKSEVSSIYRKLGVSTRGQAVHQAAAIGLLAA